MTALTTLKLNSTELGRCLGCGTEAIRRFRSRNPSFPRPKLTRCTLFYDAGAVRAWVAANDGFKRTNRRDETPITLALFDARLDEILNRKSAQK
jgi:hypothetical protein